MTPRPGDRVRLAMTKWGGQPHWEFDAMLLGSDESGDWLGIPAGTVMTRPGMTFVTETAQAGLVPAASAGGGRGWLATFHAPGYLVSTYVDMTTAPDWDDATVRAVDLDLDVIRLADGDVVIDDEEEFADHRVSLGYPPEVVDLAELSCAWVHAAVLHEWPPFDGRAQAWLDLLASP